MPLLMYIHHLYLPTSLIIHQLSSKNCLPKHYPLQHKLWHLPRNRHCLVVTLKDQSNLDIHYSLQSHLLAPIFKTTSKSQTTNFNQAEILFLPILLVVRQLLPAIHLPLCHLHASHSKLLSLMKFRKLQSFTRSHTIRQIVNRRNDTLSMDLQDLL